MKKYLAQASTKTSSTGTTYAMYIGRWQPWHPGHRWLIDQSLHEGKNVLICIRDVAPDEKNPFMYHCHMANHEDGGMMAKIQVVPPSSCSRMWQ